MLSFPHITWLDHTKDETNEEDTCPTTRNIPEKVLHKYLHTNLTDRNTEEILYLPPWTPDEEHEMVFVNDMP